MPEILLALLDDQGGELLLDTSDADLASAMEADLAEQLGTPEGLACARPNDMQLPTDVETPGAVIRISGIWHQSLIEAPGRRSVVRMQGCPIRCQGCYVPETWDFDAGENRSVEAVAAALLDPDQPRDGVTLLGGEPFAQPHALAELVEALRAADPEVHILSYTGYTLEALQRRGDPYIDFVLDQIDVLIDGPYVLALSGGAGPWTGSGNQRVIDMNATRSASRVVAYVAA